jgi:hypothetical protein
MRNNHSFLNRVSFRRRAPTRSTPIISVNNINTNSNLKSISTTTLNAMRSCIDTVSETASITQSENIILPHEGSSSGKICFFQIIEINKMF